MKTTRAGVMAVGTERDDRGAILPIMGLILVALLAMAAIVVDLGGARETRRRNQGSVDASALGGAQQLPDETGALAKVTSLIQNNLGFAPNLNQCSGGNADPNALAVPATGANCVSFDAGASEIRVFLPDTYKTAFGKVVGAASLGIRTGATALKSPAGEGGVLPFGIGVAGTGQEVCLKTGSGGGEVGVCAGPSTGNFHYLNVAQYGNTDLKTTQQCGNGSHDARLVDNTAIGIDHFLSSYGPTSIAGNAGLVDVEDAALPNPCGPYSAAPDDLATETGNIDSVITGPLLTDAVGSNNESDKLGARLARGSFVCGSGGTNHPGTLYQYSCNKIENGPPAVYADDTPLWHFIGSGNSHSLGAGANVPPTCLYSVFDAKLTADLLVTQTTRQTDMQGLLDKCFDDYASGNGCTSHICTDPVFAYNSSSTDKPDLYDIQYSARFAYAPVVCNSVVVGASPPSPCTTPFPSGSGNVFILRQQAVFVQELTDDSAKNLDFAPGVGYSGGSHNITNIIGYAFPPNMLPGHLGDNNAPEETDVNVTINLVR